MTQQTESPPGSRRILLVEDHEDTARLMVRLLSGSGYSAAAARTGAAAIELAGRERFDLIISDLSLPDIDGRALLPKLLQRTGTLPAIALSGMDSEDEIQQSRSAGFVEHLSKPVSFPQLLEAIRRLVG